MIDQIGRFHVRKRLGGGGFGEVFLAEDPSIGRQVAIKLFRPKEENLIALATPTAEEGLASLRARFLHEAKILARLDDEPHVVSVLEFGELADGTPYYVMPYLPCSVADELGRDVYDVHGLAELPATNHPRALPLEAALTLVEQTLQGLAAAHEQGLVHRDIKPANLMRSAKGVLQIVDFGIAKAPDSQHSTVSHVGLGSRNYMAPEQRESAKRVDARADLYAVGVVAYRALTGKLPVGRYADPNILVPALGKSLNEVVLRLLAQDKANRPKDAGEALALFQQARTSASPSTSAEQSGTWAGEEGPAELRDELKPLRARIIAVVSEQGFVDQESRADLRMLARMGNLDEAGLEALIEATVKADKTLTAKANLGELIREKLKNQGGELGERAFTVFQYAAASIGWDDSQLGAVIRVATSELPDGAAFTAVDKPSSIAVMSTSAYPAVAMYAGKGAASGALSTSRIWIGSILSVAAYHVAFAAMVLSLVFLYFWMTFEWNNFGSIHDRRIVIMFLLVSLSAAVVGTKAAFLVHPHGRMQVGLFLVVWLLFGSFWWVLYAFSTSNWTEVPAMLALSLPQVLVIGCFMRLSAHRGEP